MSCGNEGALIASREQGSVLRWRAVGGLRPGNTGSGRGRCHGVCDRPAVRLRRPAAARPVIGGSVGPRRDPRCGARGAGRTDTCCGRSGGVQLCHEWGSRFVHLLAGSVGVPGFVRDISRGPAAECFLAGWLHRLVQREGVGGGRERICCVGSVQQLGLLVPGLSGRCGFTATRPQNHRVLERGNYRH